jgi:hypothetical protein
MKEILKTDTVDLGDGIFRLREKEVNFEGVQNTFLFLYDSLEFVSRMSVLYNGTFLQTSVIDFLRCSWSSFEL